jgi:hypothetical protein
VSLADATPEPAFIKAGTLEDRSWLEPQMHVWSESAQPWFPFESHSGPKLLRGVSA